MKKHIPNAITLLNVLSGCIAVVFAAYNQLEYTALFVFLGVIFDFLDGFAARILKVHSDLGLQLDSMADMITSGLVPGLVLFQLLRMSLAGGWNIDTITSDLSHMGTNLLPFAGFIITMASAYRLAKFNIDENQKDSFIGLPTPANALFVVSLPLILYYQDNTALNDIILNSWFLVGVVLINSYLLNANLPLFALKFKNWGFKDNGIRYVFLFLCIVMLVVLGVTAIPFIIMVYVLLSIIHNNLMSPK